MKTQSWRRESLTGIKIVIKKVGADFAALSACLSASPDLAGQIQVTVVVIAPVILAGILFR